MNIQTELFNMKDTKYKEFNQKLIPTVDKNTIIGIRTPVLRRFAKTIKNSKEATDFLNTLPHTYYEENNLHAFLIGEIGDFGKCIEKLDIFLPFIDNWATCDSLRPVCFKKNTDKLLIHIKKWLKSENTYTVRFAIETLMIFFLDSNFKNDYLDMVALVKSDEYYINMMIAWFFATALAKQYESTLPFLQKNILPLWVHNKTIQKAVESYRITEEQKVYLKTLKRSI